MTVGELIQYLAGFPADRQVLLNMTTGQMEQFKFVSVGFVDEVGVPDMLGGSKEVVLISHTAPGEEEDTSQQ